MAMAVQRLYPGMRVAIGPWIDNGFYYDFCNGGGRNGSSGSSHVLTERDFKRIKKEMGRIIRADLPLIREEVSFEEAERRIVALGDEPYKLELLRDIVSRSHRGGAITIYHVGEEWWDLCAGPHVESTGVIDPSAVEIETVAGAYWRGDESNAQLQRLYGTAWENRAQLAEYKRLKKEAARRDHRLLGRSLDLFSIQEQAGGGLVFWHPKGATVRRVLEDYWREAHLEAGYDLVFTPHIANLDLWKQSGHYDFYREDMFSPMEVERADYMLRPMNCPFHCLVYKSQPRSYRELPLRWAELGTVYRNERSGTMHGLMRVRGFTQDDAHIFCLPEQIADEIIGVLDLVERILTRFGFSDYQVMLSTRPAKSIGEDAIWHDSTAALEEALERKGWSYGVDEGGGAFYGPKIDIKIKDAIGRTWQCSTIQCDFNLPERFELEYRAGDGAARRPIMIHRAIFGSVERFFGVMLEDCAGDFPLWLAPEQLRILAVTDAARSHCEGVLERARAAGLRAQVDTSGDRLGKQIRNAEKDKIPVVCVVGEREVASDTASVRARSAGGEVGTMATDELLRALRLAAEAGERAPDLKGDGAER